MIRAGPDGPGGGPDDPETRLVEAQGRMSGWRSGRPGRVRMIQDGVRMIRLRHGASGVFRHICRSVQTDVRIIWASAGSSETSFRSSGQAESWLFFSSIFLLRFFLSLEFSMVAPEVPEYAKSL